ncbi:cytochrome c3 family protein [Mariniblastus fucicola]|uniref:Doubled CXXCH motif (Paired_CXXCH_1) n=1 Tax=Mariniblastus fucicola TaxID=980251 RepID=A0A5B9PEZ2_9BACT|nr:hypothetical protein [Mariniblastus fucicola]QEG24109.1 Doubled CXXCH motif (Paired_CXXCH_1) [Mariniblastus fucicola]
MSVNSEDDLRLQDFSDTFYHRPHDPTVEIPAGIVKPWPTRDDGNRDLSEEEPTLTRPSLRQRRKVLSLCVIAFTIGALMIVLSSPYSNEFLAPGPLHSSHAQLLAGHGADRCAACHSGTTGSAFGWVAHAFSGASNKQTQSKLCLECHKASLNEDFALNPHNVAPQQLAKTTAQFQNASFVSNLTIPPVTANNEIACNACHREHKGAQDLQAMTDAQCQSCHQSNYHSFESDHPEFTSWPKASRQNIAFDHSTHASRHFPGSNAVFDCSRCHLDDAWQNAKVQAPFEQACASCHEKKIVDSGVGGFAVLSLPMLDMKAIEKRNLKVGSWPLAATGDFDGPLPPAMRLLLMADPRAGPILNSRPASFEFADLDPGDDRDVQEAVTLAWSVKRLLHELSRKGVPAVERRIETVLGRDLDAEEVRGMFRGMEGHSFAAAARRWFPRLNAEIKTRFGESSAADVSSLINPRDFLAKVPAQEQLARNPLAGLDENSAGTEAAKLQSQTSPQRTATEPNVTPPFSTSTQQANVSPAMPRSIGEEPVSALKPETGSGLRTGWIRDDRSLRIYYRPAGHQDEFLKHWFEMMLATPDADSSAATSELYRSLTGTGAIGNCRYCHTLKRNEDRSLVMNWNANRRNGALGQFTSFSHRPHLVQPALQDCSHCHKMDASVSNGDSFASLDRTDYESNFHPILKSTCSSCHQKGLTDNSCTTCHDYHVGGHKTR